MKLRAMPTPAQRLIHAVRTQNFRRLGELLAQKGAVEERSKAGRTALHAAAEEGDLEAARILVGAGADVNARAGGGETPLQSAAGYGRAIDLMDEDLDRRDCLARSRNHPISKPVAEVVLDLMKQKNPRIPDDLDLTQGFREENRWDIFSGMMEVFADAKTLQEQIAARGIDIDLADPAFAEFLRGNPRYVRVAEFLLDHGADVNSGSDGGETPLSAAVECGSLAMVELLLSRGANVNLPRSNDEEEELIIWRALEFSKPEVAELLWKHGAALPGAAELNYLAGNWQKKEMLWLIDRGIGINARAEGGNTPILSAAANGHHEIISALLERGADFRVRDAAGDSLVHKSADWVKCLEVVLPLGLDVNARNKIGRTPLHHASQSGDYFAMRKLLAAGASPNIQDDEGNTPLHLIFDSDEYRPDAEFPEFHALVAGGADRSIVNNAGKTAADIAVEVRYPEEYLQLLDPVKGRPASDFIWLGEPPFDDFLPRAMIAVELDGQTWPSVEHYFHAQKTTDLAVREHMRMAPTPSDAPVRFREAREKQTPNSIRMYDWSQKCDSIMRRTLLAKFQQHAALRELLLGSGEAVLISDGNCDNYWMERTSGRFNELGRMLMDIRGELRRGSRS